MNEERCDVTDLLTDQCGHCLNGGKPIPKPQKAQRPKRFIEAKYAGTCVDCGDRYGPGDDIAWTEFGWVCCD